MKSGRILLSFNVVGMAAREAMLLKSFVRMLDGRTKHRWLFKPQQDGDEQQSADLIFLGDEGTESESPRGNTQALRQLRMGVLALDLFARLDRPLRPDELERELNRMGTLMVQARAAQMVGETPSTFTSTLIQERVGDAPPSSLWRPVAEGSTHSEFAPITVFSNEFAGTVPAGLLEKVSAAAASPAPASPPEVKIQVALNDGLSLLRWPHANLVSTPARLKLAAFLVGSTTLNNLQKNSDQTPQACAEFVRDLYASGFLKISPEDQKSAAGEAKLNVVRAQTGAAVAVKPMDEKFEKPEKTARHAPDLPSLFDRIRSRLGISVAG